jgi:hypothetical protein
MIAQSCNTDVANWGLEFDEGMGAVVGIRGAGLTASTEIGVVADGALVPVSLDIGLGAILAKRAVAVNTVVACLATVQSRQSCSVCERLVDWYEAVSRMNEVGIRNAGRAEVPVWAVEALVTNTIDVLITTITNGIMASVTAWGKKGLCHRIKVCALNGWYKCMLGVMTMLHADMARNAKIKVEARCASDEVFFREFY